MRLNKDKPIYFGGKKVGIIKRNRTYVTHRRDVHIFRKYNGLGMSGQVLAELRKYNVREIIIIYACKDGSQDLFKTSVSIWYERGIRYTDKRLDHQFILPFSILNEHVKRGAKNEKNTNNITRDRARDTKTKLSDYYSRHA